MLPACRCRACRIIDVDDVAAPYLAFYAADCPKVSNAKSTELEVPAADSLNATAIQASVGTLLLQFTPPPLRSSPITRSKAKESTSSPSMHATGCNVVGSDPGALRSPVPRLSLIFSPKSYELAPADAKSSGGTLPPRMSP